MTALATRSAASRKGWRSRKRMAEAGVARQTNRQSRYWTAERVKLLSALWAEGLTGGEIAIRLGCSRGKVLGKLHRLGLLGNISESQRARRISRGVRSTWTPDRVRRHREIMRFAWLRRKGLIPASEEQEAA